MSFVLLSLPKCILACFENVSSHCEKTIMLIKKMWIMWNMLIKIRDALK